MAIYYNKNILQNNTDIYYVSNFDFITSNLSYIDSNIFLLSSYNYDFIKNYNHYVGTSYELYYIDNDKNIHQLTYNILPGNGLSIDDNMRMNINIDNNTLQQNENKKLYVNQHNFKLAYYNVNGLAKGNNLFYYNNLSKDNFYKNGSVYSENGYLSLNTGLLMDLYDISNYLTKAKKLELEIEQLYSDIIDSKISFKLGDILYQNNDGEITLNHHDKPFMICVIASGILEDGYARFAKLNRKQNKVKFALNNMQIPIKSTYNGVPVFNADYNNLLNESDAEIISSSYGFIATDRNDWSSYYPNKFNSIEHYFVEPKNTMTQINIAPNLNYDNSLVSVTEVYKLQPYSLVFDKTNNYSDNNELNMQLEIHFEDGFIGNYNTTFIYSSSSQRYELQSTIVPNEYTTAIRNIVLTTNVRQSNNVNISANLTDMTTYYINNNVKQESINNNYENTQSLDATSTHINTNLTNNYSINNSNNTNTSSNNISAVSSLNNISAVSASNINSASINNSNSKLTNNNSSITNNNSTINNSTNSNISKATNSSNINQETNITETNYQIDSALSGVQTSKENTIQSTNKNINVETKYMFRLILNSGLFNIDTVYLKVSWSSDSHTFNKWIYLKYNNSTGLIYETNEIQSSPNGFFKIFAYTSPAYIDKEPYNFGKVYKCYYTETNTVHNDMSNFDYVTNIEYYDAILNNFSSFSFDFINAKIKSINIKNYSLKSFNINKIINTSVNIDNKIKLKYTLDMSYADHRQSIKDFQEGAIKIMRKDGKSIDITECNIKLLLRLSYRNENGLTFTTDVNFISSSDKKMLISKKFNYNNYDIIYVNYISILGINYINTSLSSTIISDYSFDTNGTLLNILSI